MKLSNIEVEVLVNTIGPVVSRYLDRMHNDPSDEDMVRYEVLANLYYRLKEYHETTVQLEGEPI